MKNRDLKNQIGKAVEKFRGLIVSKEQDPDTYAASYAKQHWMALSPHAMQLIAEQIAQAVRDAMRVRITEAMSRQLELDSEDFRGLPIGIPTGDGGYIGIGAANEAQIELAKLDHLEQIEGHKAAIKRFDDFLDTRRSRGIPPQMGYYDWKRQQPPDAP